MTSAKRKILPEKEFKPRNSLLTDLFEIEHFRSIRHFCLALFICSLISNTANANIGSDRIRLGFECISVAFGQFHKVILICLLMITSTVVVHPLFNIWANFRIQLPSRSLVFKLWNKVWLGVAVLYYLLFLCVPPYIKGNTFPFASSAVILGEQVRLMMKMYAFVRSNVPRVLSYKIHSDKEAPVPSLSKYLYFLFAPTFIYRDSYPRTREIRWSFVVSHFMDVLLGIVFWSIAAEYNLLPEFRNYGLEPSTWKSIIISMLNVITSSVVLIFLMFYLLFHCWLNAWAEMLTFADRQFYMDWWNASSLTVFYRKWSYIVHDFLYVYVYKDFYEIIVPGNKLAATLVVFIVSALGHEHIVMFVLGFFYPVYSAQSLILGLCFTFLKLDKTPNLGNVLLWWAIILAYAMQISLLAIEFYARINCPKENIDWTDFFIPRSWSC